MWAIGPYRLDATAFSLHRQGEPVEVQRRPLDLLLYLIGRPHQIVSRKELQEVVWGGVVVSPGALSTAVYEARAALGDLDRAPGDRWIETVRGRGFRFRGPAQRISEASTASDSPPFVGRLDIVAELTREVEQVEPGRGSIRVIEGLAGMGKTRLVQEATRGPRSATVHTVYCERGGPPYWPWMQLVRVLSRTQLEKEDGEPGWLVETSSEAEGSHFQFERLDRMLRVLASATEAGPLVLVIEDIHWADVASLALLESLGHRLRSLPVLILATHRVGEEAGDPVRAWTGAPPIQRDRLEALPAGELYEFVGALIGRLPSPEFVGWIQKHSGGVPLMVRELAEQSQGDETSLPDVPQLAQLMLARRFDGLGAEGRRTIAVAALCGERFDVPLVEAAAEDGMDGTRTWLREGLASGILVADPRHPLRFAFRHSLLRDAARGALSAEEAAEWHGRLANVLERQHPDPHRDAVSQLARHSAASALIERDLERPLRYALLAARNASDVFAWEEVRVHSEHALGWVGFMPPGEDRDVQELDAALLRCAGITPYSGHVEETDALLQRIAPILARRPAPAARALAEGFRFANARSLGDFRSALDCADSVEEIEGMAAIATSWRLGVASLAGNLTEAVAIPAHEDALGDDPRFVEYARLCGRDPEVDRLGLTALASFCLGHDADAVERSERAVRWAEDRGDARSGIWALFMLCMLHDLRRDWRALRERAPEVDALAARHQVTPWLGVGTALAVWAASREKDEPVFPVGQFGSILRDRGHSTNVSLRTMLFLLSSRIFARCGDLASAEGSARDGLAYCEQTEERHMAAELERQLGLVLRARGDPGAARDARLRALEIAAFQGNLVAEVRTLADRIDAGEAGPEDRRRLNALRKRLGARFGANERALLDRVSAGTP